MDDGIVTQLVVAHGFWKLSGHCSMVGLGKENEQTYSLKSWSDQVPS